ncbi:MAG: hypothetical protein NBKEAIPA_00430 [Nitrospirae bacterium]|nr:MAG: peroxiredoxin [Nitrospira sp. OLB3]MBV6468564.1 hypothetical protein [Nitrospirota bacterium]MCK6491864.1 peroxiredoxin family protein [Nitrospira sp.]MEB2339985.1 redoxin domain-containing protein [Nitrospirales bacterium]QOJ35746.1 MAG: redoxin domain-containing protein [Nitrospira sp.]
MPELLHVSNNAASPYFKSEHARHITTKEVQRMIEIGQKIPAFRVPALKRGTLTLCDLSSFRGQWLALCAIPSFGLHEATFLARHQEDFERDGARLVVLCPEVTTLHAEWIRLYPTLRLPMLADPLMRIHRSLNLSRHPSDGRCRSVLVDPAGTLRFHLTHDLNAREIEELKIVLSAAQPQTVHPARLPQVPRSKGALTSCVR